MYHRPLKMHKTQDQHARRQRKRDVYLDTEPSTEIYPEKCTDSQGENRDRQGRERETAEGRGYQSQSHRSLLNGTATTEKTLSGYPYSTQTYGTIRERNGRSKERERPRAQKRSRCAYNSYLLFLPRHFLSLLLFPFLCPSESSNLSLSLHSDADEHQPKQSSVVLP